MSIFVFPKNVILLISCNNRQENMVTPSKPRQEKTVTLSKTRRKNCYMVQTLSGQSGYLLETLSGKQVTLSWSKLCQEKMVTQYISYKNLT